MNHAELRETLDQELRGLPKPVTHDDIVACARRVLGSRPEAQQFEKWLEKCGDDLLVMLNG
jgi:hypothetical protein